jgi:hypothetical protein
MHRVKSHAYQLESSSGNEARDRKERICLAGSGCMRAPCSEASVAPIQSLVASRVCFSRSTCTGPCTIGRNVERLGQSHVAATARNSQQLLSFVPQKCPKQFSTPQGDGDVAETTGRVERRTGEVASCKEYL